MVQRTVAAIAYDSGQGAQTDDLLAEIAHELQHSGHILAGTIQRSFDRADRCACDMLVRDLSTGIEVKISEDRGVDARGCRLNQQQLEGLVGSTLAALEGNVDVVILNKFGKQEMLGRGFRDCIGQTLAARIPTIIGVNRTYLDAWRQFAGDYADELIPERRVVETWLATRVNCLDETANTSEISAHI